jgi:Xaa-Pro aminopeptidase
MTPARLRAMMGRNGLDLIFVCDPVNSKYLSGFFHNGGDHDGAVGARPFVVLYFLDETMPPALLVPAVDVHLAMDSSWIADVRGYVAAERRIDLDVPLFDDVFSAAASVLADRGVKSATIGTERSQLSVSLAARLGGFLAWPPGRRHQPGDGPGAHGQDAGGAAPHPDRRGLHHEGA